MTTLVEVLDEAAEKHGHRIAVKSMLDPREYSFRDVRANARSVRSALAQSGVQKGDRVVVVTDNCPEFLFADFGVLCRGAISVPVNQNLLASESGRALLKRQIDFVEPRAVLALDRYAESAGELTSAQVISVEQALTEPPLRPWIETSDNDIATLIFSSGTTRGFKAIALTHNNIASNVLDCQESVFDITEGVYMDGIAEHGHSFSYMVQKAMLYSGALLHFTNLSGFVSKGHATKINPHYCIVIPRVANRMLAQIKKNVAKVKGKEGLAKLEAAIADSVEYYRAKLNQGRFRPILGLKHLLADIFGYSKIRAGIKAKTLGQNLKYMICGSAPLDRKTQEQLVALGLWIYPGFGLTETSPVMSVLTPKDYRFGSSGKLIPNVEALIVDPDTMQEVPIGEQGLILARGPNVFKEYWNDPEATAAAFVNGWFNTEDLGKFDKDGFLYITGRYKRLICLTSGQKISPEPIEARLEESPYLSRLVVVGDSKKYPGGLLVPQPEYAKQIADGHLDEAEFIQMCFPALEAAYATYDAELKPHRLGVLPKFDEAKYVTSTRKLRFEVFNDDHAALIDDLCK